LRAEGFGCLLLHPINQVGIGCQQEIKLCQLDLDHSNQAFSQGTPGSRCSTRLLQRGQADRDRPDQLDAQDQKAVVQAIGRRSVEDSHARLNQYPILHARRRLPSSRTGRLPDNLRLSELRPLAQDPALSHLDRLVGCHGLALSCLLPPYLVYYRTCAVEGYGEAAPLRLSWRSTPAGGATSTWHRRNLRRCRRADQAIACRPG